MRESRKIGTVKQHRPTVKNPRGSTLHPDQAVARIAAGRARAFALAESRD